LDLRKKKSWRRSASDVFQEFDVAAALLFTDKTDKTAEDRALEALAIKEGQMRTVLYGLAALPLLAGAALAEAPKQAGAITTAKQPMQLNDQQMDKVNAGFLELKSYNSGLEILSLFYTPNLGEETGNIITCNGCYLVINSSRFSLASSFGFPSSLSAPDL
jgi:hypothetical protein